MQKIEWLVNDLEDVFFITEKIKKNHPELEKNVHYQRIVQAIEVLEKEHDILYEQIK